MCWKYNEAQKEHGSRKGFRIDQRLAADVFSYCERAKSLERSVAKRIVFKGIYRRKLIRVACGINERYGCKWNIRRMLFVQEEIKQNVDACT